MTAFPTITGKDWKQSIARSRATPNSVSAQIAERTAAACRLDPNPDSWLCPYEGKWRAAPCIHCPHAKP